MTLEEYLKKRNEELAALGITGEITAPVRSPLAQRRAEDLAKQQQEESDIAPTQAWFQAGALKNGVTGENVGKAILGTLTDAGENLGTGVLGMGEKALDALAWLAPIANNAYQAQNSGLNYSFDIGQYRKQQADAASFIQKDLYDEAAVARTLISAPVKKLTGVDAEKDSVLGEKADALVQSAGQLAAQYGLQMLGVPWFLTSGATSFGSEAENALKQGATYGQAGASAAVSAGAEILTEKLFGGDLFTKKAGVDKATAYLSTAVSDKVIRTLAKLGVDMAGEGMEEVASQIIGNLGSALYREEKLGQILFSEQALEEYVDSFVGGTVLGGGMGAFKAIQAGKSGVDFTSGLTKNEEAVVNKLYNEAIAEESKNGETVTAKRRKEIYSEVLEQMDKGIIPTEVIEEVLGGETYRSYKDTADSEAALIKQEKALSEEVKGLNKLVWQEMTGEQHDRLEEARWQLSEVRKKIAENKENGARDRLKDQLGREVSEMVKGDRLTESYAERGRRGQRFQADVTQYTEKQRATVQAAIDSGVLNNTNRSHAFVDFVAKISADKGVAFNFADNKRLKESGFALEDATVNGFVNGSGVTVNVNSAKALNSVVGHEITHVLEGTELYDTLKQTITEYAKGKGEYDARLERLTKLYEGKEGYEGADAKAKIEREVVADLVGDYLFTDKAFVENLSTQNRNVFQKLYDEVKYLCKVVTAGSKEAKQLLQVKKVFEEAYRAEVKNTANSSVQYSLTEYSEQQKKNWSTSKRIIIYDNPEQLSQFIQDSVANKTMDKKMYFGAIPSDLAARIQTDAGVDVKNYNLSLGSYEIRKILKDHGNESTEAPRGQRAIVKDDFAHIVDIVLNPKNVALSEDTYMGKPAIIFTGEHNGRMNVIAVVSDKRLDLFVQTVFVNVKKGNLATPTGEQAPINTPEANNGTVSNNSIRNPKPEVNNKNSLSMQNQSFPDDFAPLPWTIKGEEVALQEFPLAQQYQQQGSSQQESGRAEVGGGEDLYPLPPGFAPQVRAEDSTGAAPSGFDPVSHLQYEYGSLPEGENAVREDSLPRSTTGKDRVSLTARTVKGAEATPDELVDLLDKETVGGRFSYIPIKNSETVRSAYNKITDEGWEASRGAWSAQVRAGKVSPELTATGALLLNNAAKAGNKTAWLDILHDYQLMGTNAGQAVQAMRILKTLSPDDSLYLIRRSVKQMVEDMKLGTDIQIDDSLAQRYAEAETEAQRDTVRKEIAAQVARQIPSTARDKWTALRYLNMLGNPRTQVRNLLGNAGMKGVSTVKNSIATALEGIAHAASGGRFHRTKSFTVSREMKQAAREDFAHMEALALKGGKFSDTTAESLQFAQDVQDARRIFRNPLLEGYRKTTNWAMDKGDLVFSKAAYARALAGYLKARGITQTDFSRIDPQTLDDARSYAVNQAQEQTFRDSNWLSDWIAKAGRRQDTPQIGKLLSDGIMPFRKTPANILIRAEEYSPLGLVNAVVKSVQAAGGKKGVTGAAVVDSWAKALTGTGLFGMGMLLNSLGILSGGPDEDEEREWFEDQYGWQNYAVHVGDTNFTIDFLSPEAMPLLMGAQMMEMMQDGGIELKEIESALLSIADPMIEMSMLQGVNDTLDNIRYAESSGGQLLVDACLSYLTQGLTNSMLGQFERAFETRRMSTFVDKDNPLPDWLQKTLGKNSAKIPGLDYNQIPYINAWGEEEKNELLPELLKNTLSPAYIEQGKADAVYTELNRLNDAQSDVNVYPQTPDKTLTFEDKNGVRHEDYHLSAEEYVRLAKLQGQTQKQLVEDIISSGTYAQLTDQEKAKAVQLAYTYAREYSRQKILGADGFSTPWMGEVTGDLAEAIISHTSEERTEAYDHPGKYTMIQAIMPDYSDYQKVVEVFGSFNAKDENGNSVNGLKKERVYDYIFGELDMDYGAKCILFKSQGYKIEDSMCYEIVEYLNGRNDLSYEQVETILKELGFTVDDEGNIDW